MKEYKVSFVVSDGEETDGFEFFVEANSIVDAVENLMDELDV